jgi:hypothetical protein
VHPQLFNVLCSGIGLATGGLIGLSFGVIQEKALRHNEARQLSGQLNNGWAVMPGSMRRVACLLAVLAVIQAFCPLLFTNNCQWWVTAGVVGGYGWSLYSQFRQRLHRYRR